MSNVIVEREGAVASVILPGPALSLAVKERLLESRGGDIRGHFLRPS